MSAGRWSRARRSGLALGAALVLAGACAGGDSAPEPARQPTTTSEAGRPPDGAGPIDRDEAARKLAEAFDLTPEQAQCGVDRLDDRVLAAFVAADFELEAMDEDDATIVYQAGLECVGQPGA